MRNTWKIACENKDEEVIRREMTKVIDNIKTTGEWDKFTECKDLEDCEALECIDKVRRRLVFGEKSPSKFCSTEGDLFGEEWDDKPLDDVFLHTSGTNTFCFTREELTSFKTNNEGGVILSQNPYTGVYDLNVGEMLKQRWEDLLVDEDDEEEELGLDAQLSVGLASAFDTLPSYQSVDSGQFKEMYPDKGSLIAMIVKLLSIQVHPSNPFRTMFNIDKYPDLNSMPELWAQFANDVKDTPNRFQVALALIIKGESGDLEEDDPEEWGLLAGRLTGTTVRRADGSIERVIFDSEEGKVETFYRLDGSNEKDIYYTDGVKVRETRYRLDGSKEDIIYNHEYINEIMTFRPDGSKEKYTIYDGDGVKEVEILYKLDERREKSTEYRPDGSVQSETIYRINGSYEKRILYRRDGSKEREIMFRPDGNVGTVITYGPDDM